MRKPTVVLAAVVALSLTACTSTFEPDEQAYLDEVRGTMLMPDTFNDEIAQTSLDAGWNVCESAEDGTTRDGIIAGLWVGIGANAVYLTPDAAEVMVDAADTHLCGGVL